MDSSSKWSFINNKDSRYHFLDYGTRQSVSFNPEPPGPGDLVVVVVVMVSPAVADPSGMVVVQLVQLALSVLHLPHHQTVVSGCAISCRSSTSSKWHFRAVSGLAVVGGGGGGWRREQGVRAPVQPGIRGGAVEEGGGGAGRSQQGAGGGQKRVGRAKAVARVRRQGLFAPGRAVQGQQGRGRGGGEQRRVGDVGLEEAHGMGSKGTRARQVPRSRRTPPRPRPHLRPSCQSRVDGDSGHRVCGQ